jgi:RNA polymerase sigma factor (sigma-70 family)
LNDIIDISKLKQGDYQSFVSLVDLYSEKIYNLTLSILQNQEDAEDITQEVFETVFLSLATFKEEAQITTWIYRIAVNKCKEFLRKKARKKRFAFLTRLNLADSDLAIEVMHPGIILENNERLAILLAAIKKLPDNQQIAFTLHKLEGLSYDEITKLMQLSMSSVESLMFRARKNLKNMLESYYEKNE